MKIKTIYEEPKFDNYLQKLFKNLLIVWFRLGLRKMLLKQIKLNNDLIYFAAICDWNIFSRYKVKIDSLWN